MTKIISILVFIITGPWSYSQDRSINVQEKSELGGVKQQIFLRGKDSTNPILLILHGGPGFSEFAYFRTFNRELENKFVVVNWDQRGTHLSYNDSIEGKSMTFDQIVSDTHELVSKLKTRFGQNKVFLLAHSAGTITGVKYALRYPEDLYAYIGVGQVVNGMKNEMESLSYALKMAKRNNNKEAVAELSEVQKNYPSLPLISLEYVYTERKWLEKFGGVYHAKSFSDLFESLAGEESALINNSLANKGGEFSMQHLWKELLSVDFLSADTAFNVPVFFICGKYDHNTPTDLAKQYFNNIKAPLKQFFIFENSGHLIPFEEPDKFNKLLTQTIFNTGMRTK
ncbi:MAG: alpha/beta hydrolase [Chitinophagaceae bacterium]|nr:alpha/beta hydrolase [Chitinophagaceae bacterium]